MRYDGHVLLRLGDGVTREGYKSAEGITTDAAGGSRSLYFCMTCMRTAGRQSSRRTQSSGTLCTTPAIATSRFTPKFVTKHHETRAMVGPRGGFVFDTNALHRGEHQGNASRTVVVLEFHAHHKIPRLNGDFPCPSIDVFRESNSGKIGHRAPMPSIYPVER